MRPSLQEPGLEAHRWFLGMLYSATTNVETYTPQGLIQNHSVVEDCNSQSVYASTQQNVYELSNCQAIQQSKPLSPG